MAHLINAKAMRIGWEQDWCDIWFSKDQYYCDFLYSCFRIRYFLIYFFFRKYIDSLGFIYSHFFISIFHKIFSVYLYFYDSRLEIKYDNFRRQYGKVVSKFYKSSIWSRKSGLRWAHRKFFARKFWVYSPFQKLLKFQNRRILPNYHVKTLKKTFYSKGLSKFQIVNKTRKLHVLLFIMCILFFFKRPSEYVQRKLKDKLPLKRRLMKEGWLKNSNVIEV